jgi:hypothetical protein
VGAAEETRNHPPDFRDQVLALAGNGAVSTAIAGSLGKRHHQWINATKPARNATAKSRLRRKRPACDRDKV